jgi:hypothetical protein
LEPADHFPALRFAAACSYLPSTADGLAGQRELLRQSLASGLPPASVWEQICRHRIFAPADQVLSRHGWRSALGPYDADVRKCAQQSRLQALTLSAEAGQFSALLASHSIRHHILKGSPLSRKLYGDLGLRQCRDIDVIVEPRQLIECLKALRNAGWDWPNAERWFASRSYRLLAKSQLWHVAVTHPQYKSVIEVHWSFEHVRSGAMEAKWWAHWDANRSEVSPAEALHLCLHGASHGWKRMKWLGDLRTLQDRQPDIWQQCRPSAKELRLQAVLAQALLLLQRLYDVEPDAASREIVSSEPQAEGLARFALDKLTGKAEESECTVGEQRGFLRYQRSLARRHGAGARLAAALSAYFIGQIDLLEWRLPAYLLCVLPLVRLKGLLQRWRWLDHNPPSSSALGSWVCPSAKGDLRR